jgi:hypothetical protein
VTSGNTILEDALETAVGSIISAAPDISANPLSDTMVVRHNVPLDHDSPLSANPTNTTHIMAKHVHITDLSSSSEPLIHFQNSFVVMRESQKGHLGRA